MKTDELITMISNQAGPAPKVSVANRLVPAGVVGGLIAAAIVLGVLGLIPGEMLSEPGPWIKIGYASTLTIAAGWLFTRLGKPGASDKQATSAVVGVVLLMLMAGVLSYLGTPASERAAAPPRSASASRLGSGSREHAARSSPALAAIAPTRKAVSSRPDDLSSLGLNQPSEVPSAKVTT